jgi:thiol-disulfide isomerase/thioredoxin
MSIKKKTVLNIVFMAFVLSFFVTPLGYHSKILLNRLFSGTPAIISGDSREQIKDYNWRLKDADWNLFNFSKSKGKVVFINFWASWRLPCAAELQGIQNLYDRYQGQIDFYIITNEEQAPVEEFMDKNEFTFPVTYLIIGDTSPLTILEPPGSYILDAKGYVVVKEEGIADWDNNTVFTLLDTLLKE